MMDLSPSILIVVCVVVIAMLAWAYFDVPEADSI